MQFMRWFDTTDIRQFAEVIASDYEKLRRSVVARGDDTAKRNKRFEKVTQRVEGFNQERRLNFYQRAKMLGDIKDCLSTHGIEEDEISAFLRTLLFNRLRS